ncbi:hypothetical protein MSIBF_A1380017 [groundwater metagenome]|uniref:Uncharacterized protein n=1 Tax=groundwater metagenome TaxID=717931 RepID=A0A098E755_9ZZZZ
MNSPALPQNQMIKIKIDNLKDAALGSIIAMAVFALLIWLGFAKIPESPTYPLFIKGADVVVIMGAIIFMLLVLLKFRFLKK